MVTYHYVGHSANYKDYVAFLIANRSDDFTPLTKFSSKVTYKTALVLIALVIYQIYLHLLMIHMQ